MAAKSLKLVAYLRVSTDAQATDGLGLDVQRKAIRDWARTNGYRIIQWHSDEGISGSNGLDTRIGLHDALRSVEDGEADGLVVYRLDRLARQLGIQEGTLSKIWSVGARAFSVDLGEIPQDDPDDPMRTALRQMVGVFAQLERGMISARLRAGRRLKAERGGYAGGAPAFGVRAESGELVPADDERAAIDLIMALHGQGMSTRQIAAELDHQQIRPKRGTQWHSETVRRVVARHASA